MAHHLDHCTRCKEEFDALELLYEQLAQWIYPEEAVPVIDEHAIIQQILADSREVNSYDPQHASTPFNRPVRHKRIPAMSLAGSFVILLAVPVLACIGIGLFVSDLPVRDTLPPLPQEQAARTVVHPARPTYPARESITGSGAPQSRSAPEELNEAFVASIDAKAALDAAHAAVAVRLPQSEAAYEGWARTEYPHIMWLYDILSNPENGFQWAPEALPWNDDTGPHPLNLPFAESAQGWRRLLIASGEIYRFDWPIDHRAPNCIPRFEAVQHAATLAGYRLESTPEGAWPLPAILFTHDQPPYPQVDILPVVPLQPAIPEQPQPIPKDYAARIAADIPLTESVLAYLVLSSQLINSKDFRMLSSTAYDLLLEVQWAHTDNDCSPASLADRLHELFDLRQQIISSYQE